MAQWNSYCGKILHIKCQDFVNMKNIVGKGGMSGKSHKPCVYLLFPSKMISDVHNLAAEILRKIINNNRITKQEKKNRTKELKGFTETL